MNEASNEQLADNAIIDHQLGAYGKDEVVGVIHTIWGKCKNATTILDRLTHLRATFTVPVYTKCDCRFIEVKPV